MIKNLQEMQETRVGSLGQEDPFERKGQPTPVFLLGKSHGQRNLVSYSPWGHKESDTIDHIHTNTHEFSYLESVDSLSCSTSSHIFSSFSSFQPSPLHPELTNNLDWGGHFMVSHIQWAAIYGVAQSQT